MPPPSKPIALEFAVVDVSLKGREVDAPMPDRETSTTEAVDIASTVMSPKF